MAIHLIEEDRKVKEFRTPEIRKWLKEVVHSEDKDLGIVNIIFCSDEYLIALNRQFLEKDYYTDVISFDYSKNRQVNGDIMISVDRVKENARELGFTFPDELKRVMVHGVLHLIGYKDDTVEHKDLMTRMENLYLARLHEA